MANTYAGAYNFGLSKPIIAKYSYDSSTSAATYSEAFQCGEAVSTSVTPNYATASLYGDNKQVEEVNEFKNAAISLGVTKMPLAAKSVLFGHTIGESDNTETSKGGDTANFVGYGFTTKNSDGTYDACVLYKVKFTEGAESYATKGDSITFNTPTLSGTAFVSDADDKWRDKQYGFTTEALALAWIHEQLA